MSDLLFQNFSTVQSNQQPGPTTVVAAATLTPQSLITFVSGTTAVATIVPPVTGQHLLFLVFTDATPGTTVTTGNILNAVVPTQSVPSMFLYDPVQAKYYGWANNLT